MMSKLLLLPTCLALLLATAWFTWELSVRDVFIGLVLAVAFLAYLRRRAGAALLPAQGKFVFITGCDSGFGHATAKYLDALGIQVFAGCLFPDGEGASLLSADCSDKLRVIPLDVTKQETVDAAMATIMQSTGDEGLWGVVNNAGILRASELEITPMETFQQHLDVNLLGQIRVVQATLPLLRKSEGRIVSINSTNSYFYMPVFGAYGISKAAAEMFSNVLRLEMKKWGIKVITIHPGGFKTGLLSTNSSFQQKCYEQLTPELKKYYTPEYFHRFLDNMDTGPTLPTDLTPVCSAVTRGLLERVPSTNYRCGMLANTMVRSVQWLPTALFEYLVCNGEFNKAPTLNPDGTKKD
ncbi:estradiol 17-beta-dehydrogenase 2-like isoform X1 [Patiria miniata]|uniref:Uncharacterized protein n=1 Tax=Patiria miniata TaxID=46514 RepID=A0A914BG86_PATMI|nr:estradiol 17-beta-dehydrogenase 2-like isoform X1 [Patiria miniata]